ncbi:MAG: nucleotidyltransferase domain-containing protein [Gemmatimonadaceae bacterium]
MATMTLDDLVRQLEAAFGSELVSVVLYGSAAAGEHIAKRSDYNVLVLVRSLDLPALQREAAIARAWGEAGNPPPKTMTVDEWRASSDIFAMEYADILAHHRVLQGTPPFDGVRVAPRDLRLQLEHETMGLLLQLRQRILAAGNERKRQLDVLAGTLSAFMVVFRATLRLHGEEPSRDYEVLAGQLAARAGIDAAPFVRVIQHLRGAAKIPEQDATTVLAGYLSGAQQLVAHIDQVQPS